MFDETPTHFNSDSLLSFDYDPRTRVVFGAGQLARLGPLAREIGGQSILLVSDPGIRHRKLGGAVEAAQMNLDRGAGRRVMDRILNQVA